MFVEAYRADRARLDTSPAGIAQLFFEDDLPFVTGRERSGRTIETWFLCATRANNRLVQADFFDFRDLDARQNRRNRAKVMAAAYHFAHPATGADPDITFNHQSSLPRNRCAESHCPPDQDKALGTLPSASRHPRARAVWRAAAAKPPARRKD